MNRRKFLKIVCFGTVGAAYLPIFKESIEWIVPTYEPDIITPDGPGSGRWILQDNIESQRSREIRLIVKRFKIPPMKLVK